MYLKHETHPVTRVILVRHGQSTYNALGLYQGCSDESILTEKGRYAARQTGTFLRGIEFAAIYSSYLKRVQETAKEIVREISPTLEQKTIHITPKLRETNLPAWEGLAFQYVREQFPDDYRQWKQFPHQLRMEISPHYLKNFAPDCHQTIELDNKQYFYPAREIYHRVEEFWQEILPRHLNQTILIVAHGGTNRALISTAIGLKADRYHAIQQSNCGISVLHFPDGCLKSGQLAAVNLTNHLGENIPKLQEGDEGLRLLLIPSEENLPNSTGKLREILKDIAIDFSLTEDRQNCQEITNKLLEYHPETVQILVLREDLSKIWSETIEVRNKLNNSNQLITGLVIASDTKIKSLIGEAIGMNRERIKQLNIDKETVSIIHYPNIEHPPILQAMNISSPQSNSILNSIKQPTVAKE